METEIAGLQVEFVAIPGETDDQIGIWLPKEKAFVCADDIYKAFPNLYAIRGTPNRDLHQWYQSIDNIRLYNPQYLVPSHTTPIEGKQTISDLLTIYRDAIQYVHDQTLRHMNKGRHPDDIVDLVKLPDNLANHPYLHEFYGTVAWSVRGTFTGYLGWFSGHPEDLNPLTRKQRASKFISFVGGKEKVIEEASNAIKNKDYQWALEVTTIASQVGNDKRINELRVDALEGLALGQTSMNGRNYYFTSAEEIQGSVINELPATTKRSSIISMPIKQTLMILSMRVVPELAYGLHIDMLFNFTDNTKSVFVMTLRNCIAELIEFDDGKMSKAKKVENSITTSEETFKQIISKDKTFTRAYITGDIKISGDQVRQFFGVFDTEEA